MRIIELLLGTIVVVFTRIGLIHCLAISVRRRTSQFDGILGCIPEKVLKVLL